MSRARLPRRLWSARARIRETDEEVSVTDGSHTDRANRPSRAVPLLVALLVGVVVAVIVGLLARQTAADPDTWPGGPFRLFFSDPLYLKAWFTTAALIVALAQPLTGAWLFRWVSWRRPKWLGLFHRIAGWLTLALTLPVAYLCVFKFGFYTEPDRVLVHCLLGCALYGAFAAKVIVVHMRRSPPWAYALAGGLVFAILFALWWVSAFWLFNTFGFGI